MPFHSILIHTIPTYRASNLQLEEFYLFIYFSAMYYRTLHNPVPTESTLFSRGGTGFSKDFFYKFS